MIYEIMSQESPSNKSEKNDDLGRKERNGTTIGKRNMQPSAFATQARLLSEEANQSSFKSDSFDENKADKDASTHSGKGE